jgi:hypothetical protein
LVHANLILARRLPAHEPLLVSGFFKAAIARRARQFSALDAVAPDLIGGRSVFTGAKLAAVLSKFTKVERQAQN